jgi:single-strand DNA-binding protein
MSTDVTLRGRLTRDPELRFSASGKAVTKFAVVTSRRFKNQQTGEWEDRDTTFWDCVAFNELAENVANSLEKGTAVVVTGHASQEEWEAKDGTKRKSMKVTAEDVAPSLRFATVKIARATRSGPAASSAPAAEADPWATEDKPPF